MEAPKKRKSKKKSKNIRRKIVRNMESKLFTRFVINMMLIEATREKILLKMRYAI